MNNKGQALIEFVMILPVIILILFGSIDLGNLFITKYQLINDLDQIIENIDKPIVVNQIINDQDLKLQTKNITGGIKYTVYQSKELITPGLSLVIENPVNIKVSRTIYE